MFDPVVSRVAELMAIGQIITKAQAQWVSCCIHTNWTTMCYILHAHTVREIMLWRQMVYSQFVENLMACCGQKWRTSVNQNSKSKNGGCKNQNNELKDAVKLPWSWGEAAELDDNSLQDHRYERRLSLFNIAIWLIVNRKVIDWRSFKKDERGRKEDDISSSSHVRLFGHSRAEDLIELLVHSHWKHCED